MLRRIHSLTRYDFASHLHQTGRLGEVGIGSTRAEVEATFCLPQNWDGRHDRKRATIWKYGANDIHFSKNIVFMIFMHDMSEGSWSGNIASDVNGIDRHMNDDEVESWLLEHEITLEKCRVDWCDEGVEFRAASGVTLTLCAEIGDQSALLSSVSLMHR